ncbi:hypothetical protein [Oxalicibacterium solurbis]|uniref:hypothetical protein n=1 Tax=Oxalicibacterium solurbis TaxID=69280 RepID=UPI001669CF21|nr:hypothetical protein [Oxalicibacterium solurbis]
MSTSAIHRGPGLYIVTLTNTHPISVNADRPAIAERCIKVTHDNCKFGKALNLNSRRANYFKTFGKQYVRFFPIAAVAEPHLVESLIAKELLPFRIRGLTGRPSEWLSGISPQMVETIVLTSLVNSGLEFTLLGSLVTD